MQEDKRFERNPEASRRIIERELQPTNSDGSSPPAEVFPPFDDPAFSAEPAEPPPVDPKHHHVPPKDTEYAGHPDFSQDAATNKRPPGEFGNSEPIDEVNEKTHHSDGQNPPGEGRA